MVFGVIDQVVAALQHRPKLLVLDEPTNGLSLHAAWLPLVALVASSAAIAWVRA